MMVMQRMEARDSDFNTLKILALSRNHTANVPVRLFLCEF
jgi:hypothetical protein